ncbi:hypothetical protein [Engelhardtia mirabilis]|uniref:Uncharacterized protein n=1 Tax=Engelhardtia mirabilis TaxID=2528011 RepID=A0A518BSF5_9BACT|nr:hypothetical protein Pla133_50240 [Planctomycetes bacterium Pla133]QDV04227.1 hypothetical protein Pla86_50220 [Planctomycetes bacterium Pla86]
MKMQMFSASVLMSLSVTASAPAPQSAAIGKSFFEALVVADNLRMSVYGSPEHNALHVQVKERAGESDPWFAWEERFDVAYALRAATVVPGQGLLVAGQVLRTGEDVVEFWALHGNEGSYEPRLTSGGPVPTGSPLATTSTVTARVVGGGGVYLPPIVREPSLTATRVELFRGVLGSGIEELAADPELRFFFACTTAGALVRFDVTPAAVLAGTIALPVAGSAQESQMLMSSVESLTIREAPMLGRLLTATVGDYWFIWTDGANDGYFEGVWSGSLAEAASIGFEYGPQHSEDFVIALDPTHPIYSAFE